MSEIYRPELIFCLCAASGTDTNAVVAALSTELRDVGYNPHVIRLSALMREIPGCEILKSIKFEDLRIRRSMEAGNRIREAVGFNDAMVRLAITEISKIRQEIEAGSGGVPLESNCFIISSLKRREEIDTLRALYGQRVFLISIYENAERRIENLSNKIARSRNNSDFDAFKSRAKTLSDIDRKESSSVRGQRLEDVYPTADVFFRSRDNLREDVRRFIQLLFGAPFITPNIDELLMFHARSAAQRSADLSRQVGAVIATKSGEILSTGCNEVPRAGGGVNWDDVSGSDADYRDYKIGQDAAAAAKKEIVSDIFEKLKKAKWLSLEKQSMSSDELAQVALFSEEKPLSSAMVSSILEFGRIVHAEMAAICDAALRGISLRQSTLYCTTFPCHMCARHIIASGIERVVYIEPYPKSRAKKLYKQAISVDDDRDAETDAVKFSSFVGVAPSRFLDLFEMVPRKDAQGYARDPGAPSRGIPKGVARGSLSAELEAEYISTVSQTDWSKIAPISGEDCFDG